jgi:ribonuclease P/MRP protein subunit POP7
VKRVRKLLDAIDKRETGNVNLLSQRKGNCKTVQTGRRGKGEAEEVSLKATARAIEKALNLAIFFQGQEDCRVRIRTGSVGVVDDIVEVEKSAGQAESSGSADNRLGKSLKRKRSESDVEDNDAGVDRATEPTELNSAVIEDEVLPETQIRKTSMVEVLISLR